MDFATSFNSFTSEPELPELMHAQTKAFTITPKDTKVLNGYLDEFQHTNTQMRTMILEKAMRDIYWQCPGNS
jgi:hypothetical protein